MLSILLKYNFRAVSIKRAAKIRHKQYDELPHLFKKYPVIKKKIDFKNPDLLFPINIPIKYRYRFSPKIVNTSNVYRPFILTGNELLMHLHDNKLLKTSQIIDTLIALNQKAKIQSLNLNEHPWIIEAIEKLLEIQQFNHMNRDTFCRFIYTLDLFDYGDEQLWQDKLSKRLEFMLPNMQHKQFAQNYVIFLNDKKQRVTPEFRKELSLLLPIHLYHISGKKVAECFRLTYVHNLMNEYLFDEHLHHIFWKRLNFFLQEGAFPQMLKLFREAKYEVLNLLIQIQTDEFLWPEVYQLLKTTNIDYTLVRDLRDELVNVQKVFPSHEEYGIRDIIKQLSERVTWEETLGGQARKLTLVDFVQNDIKYWVEKQKLQIAQN
ncbi:hypothetical protein pb186bvf_003374 [Paramecium bursaria]